MGNSEHSSSKPAYQGNPFYGYDSPSVQKGYEVRTAARAASFFLPYLKEGMSVLDCGCGPGTITSGLAAAVSPGKVIGIDLETAMVERASQLANTENLSNLSFEVADITDLHFEDNSFDAVYTCAVLEHLPDPVKALKEIHRVLKVGGKVGAISTDWSMPLISPDDVAVSLFFELFERGFNLQGGSLNRGRHLAMMMRQAGFSIETYSPGYGVQAQGETAGLVMAEYIAWVQSLPLFTQAVDLGWISESDLKNMTDGMKVWGNRPEAFIAQAHCSAVAVK